MDGMHQLLMVAAAVLLPVTTTAAIALMLSNVFVAMADGRFRFSLRFVLKVTTLVAVALGTAAYLRFW